MTLTEVMQALEALGSEQTKKVLINHGAIEPFFGVKIGDMKPLVKKIKKDHDLSLALYNTGNGDAMYFAGLIADEQKIQKSDLQIWVEKAPWQMISEYTVPWIAAESPYGWELGSEWIKSDQEKICAAGWSTLSSVLSITPDSELNIDHIEALLSQVLSQVHENPNRVGYSMNSFVIACGSCGNPLHEKALETANKIGKVTVFQGKTACKVPDAVTYIEKIREMGRLGIKKKMARC